MRFPERADYVTVPSALLVLFAVLMPGKIIFLGNTLYHLAGSSL